MGRKTKQDIIDRQKKQLETYEEAIERLQKNYHEVLQKEDDDFRRSPYFVQMEEKLKFWENIGNLSESFVSDAEKRRRELLRLIEVGASCFSHYCMGCDVSNSMSYTMSTGV